MRRRQAFTITELLVAMALIVFIMYILAEAFAAGSGAFRNLKAIGDMNERLRTTSNLLRKYLSADHFNGRARMSDPNFWQNGPPQEGFFRIWQDFNPNNVAGMPFDSSNIEGTDLDGNTSYSSQGTGQGLHFAVKFRGNNRGDFFRANIPQRVTGYPGPPPFLQSPLLLLPFPDTRFQEQGSNTLCSPWAEAALFLRATGESTDDPTNPGNSLPLFSLRLRQRVLVPDNSLVQQLVQAQSPKQTSILASDYAAGGYVEMSCYQDPNPTNSTYLYFNNPADVTMPARRLGPTPGQVSTLAIDQPGRSSPSTYPLLQDDPAVGKGLLPGDDILLTNVLSFEVRVLLPFDQWSNYYTQLGLPAANWPMYDFVSLQSRHQLDPNPNNGVMQQFAMGATPFTPIVNNKPNPNFKGFVFDTWSSRADEVFNYSAWASKTAGNNALIPLYQNAQGQKIQILAIQITIRIWDSNTRQSRQTSIVVDL